jgi:hypothetical protein
MKTLPPGVHAALRSALPAVVEEVITAVGREVPAYRRPLEGSFGEGVRLGVEVALGRFLDATHSDRALTEEERSVYERLGRGEQRQGRPVDALLSAYRVGARVSFRRFAEVALDAGLSGADLVALAESIFAYIDELSAASTAGWTEEQSRRAGQLDRQRQRVVDLLLAGAADAGAARSAAEGVGWDLADEVVLVAAPARSSEALGLRLGSRALVGARSGDAVALTSQSQGEVVRRLGDLFSAVAAPAGLAGLPGALRLARLALQLPARQGPVRVQDHLVDLLLVGDPVVVRALAERRLAPLAGTRPGTRERLADTLLAWLSHAGSRNAVAAELHLHPQTVAYRLGLLRDLFGPALDDPRARFELQVALRGGPLVDAAPGDRVRTT